MAVDYEDVQYEDSVSSDTGDVWEGEDAHLEMAYEDRFLSDIDLYGEEEF